MKELTKERELPRFSSTSDSMLIIKDFKRKTLKLETIERRFLNPFNKTTMLLTNLPKELLRRRED